MHTNTKITRLKKTYLAAILNKHIKSCRVYVQCPDGRVKFRRHK